MQQCRKVQCLHAGSAIDADDLAVNPLAVLGREEANNAGNVDGLADAVHWGPSGGVLLRTSVDCLC